MGYEPTEGQKQFHYCCGIHREEILFSSGRAAGKTTALFMQALKNAEDYPGTQILMLGFDAKTLVKTWKIKELLGVDFDPIRSELKFKNGSKIRFDNPKFEPEESWKRYGGSEFQEIFVDKKDDLEFKSKEHLLNKLRSVNPENPVLGFKEAQSGVFEIRLTSHWGLHDYSQIFK